MKFKFDSNQAYQIEAVNSIVDIFEGQTKAAAGELVTRSGLLGIYPNVLSLTKEEVLANVKKVQENNKIKNGDTVEDFDFTVEMETATGKTYCYLRTIFELHKKYGWKKFIILVPSVAIREGVIKTLKITKEHFSELYNNVPYRFYEYQSKNINQVKHFADSNHINIMVMTVASFNKDANVLYSQRDQMQGEQPISYIQQTNPILILDEPQNMEGEATKKALKNFNSLLRLRYSATHRELYNLVYQLTPYDAYQLGIVKKIEVFSITDDDSGLSRPYLNLITVKPGTLVAQVEAIAKDAKGNLKKKKISLKQLDDLARKTKNDVYAGYVVEEMTADAPDFGAVGRIRFRNGVEIKMGDEADSNQKELMKQQIEQTIRLHFEKRGKMKQDGIKVLSLFFIDKVDNYAEADGFIRQEFVKSFNKIKKEYNLEKLDVNAIHKAYFAQDKKTGELKDSRGLGETKDDITAYELIMKDKERLLSFDEPTEFIFSHSALKEGWDNPNVFNICTLRQTQSVLRKRQEIGRGMRLCVNQGGERIFARQINLLSVVANENYADYVAQLQNEFVEDGIYKAPPSPSNAKRRKTAKLKKGFAKEENFKAIWEKISKKTRYLVKVDTGSLIDRCIERINQLNITKPQITIERVGINLDKQKVSANRIGSHSEDLSSDKRIIDCIESIKNETKLTRQTVAEILVKSNNTDSFLNNPEKFCFEVIKIIKQELVKDYVEQITYELILDQYAVEQFENIQSYKDSVQPVNNSIYDAIVYDSDVEKQFALQLNEDERIKLFIKLPNWFKVDTPVGDYNPDWAIVTVKKDLKGTEAQEKLYFVIETKGDLKNLRQIEQNKIDSVKKHFEVIKVKYKEVESYEEFERESKIIFR